MESWFVIIVSLCVCFLIRAIFLTLRRSHHDSSPPLPPGPSRAAMVAYVFRLGKSFFGFKSLLKNLHAKHGPIIFLPFGSRPAIFISDPFIAHQALVQNGAVFSNRPNNLVYQSIFNTKPLDISFQSYGPSWRALRRNLTSEMLQTNRVKSFSGTRKRVLDILMDRLKSESNNAASSSSSVKVIDHLQYAMFCLLGFMCFGDKLDEKKIKEVESVQRRLLLSLNWFSTLNLWPIVTRIFFRKQIEEFLQIRKEQEDVFIPLIRARKKAKEEENNELDVLSYVDTLLDLKLPEEKRNLEESETVSVCSEFLSAGTDTTANALQWIMANLVKHKDIQQKIVEEIRENIIMGDGDDEGVREEDLNKLPYLRAVVLEGLRRHPPAHFLVPHAISENVVLNDYLIPKNATINFMVAEMGLDPKVWEDPMEFKPERFLMKSEKNNNGGKETALLEFDITGSKEIKMMPFGVGRRMCPGYNLAMLHLEYFVANLVWKFEWNGAAIGGGVDLTEKLEFTVVMENPLQVRLCPRLY